MSIYQWYQVEYEYIEIRFDELPDSTTLINDNFVLYDASLATPAIIADAFKDIDLNRDYYSISRVLRLWFNFTLASNNSYRLDISGLQTILGSTIVDDSITFETGDLTNEIIDVLPPSRDPVDVEDYSIKTVSDFSFASLTAEDVDSITATLIAPNDDIRYYLETTSNEGRIDISFNQSPAANYISSDYFRVQRKLVSRQLSRWETVDALVTADTTNNMVYIYLPSIEETPVYGEPDKDYWESGYKYRLRIQSGIGI